MREKLLVMSFLLVFTAGFVQGQIFHLKGASAISAAGGATGVGIFAELGYERFLNSKVYLKFAGNYETGRVSGASISTTLLDIAVYYGINPGGGRFFLNAGAGPSLGYEKVGNVFGAEKLEGFKYGFLIGLEPEIYVSNHVGIILPVSQRFYFQESLTRKKYQVGLGVRILF